MNTQVIDSQKVTAPQFGAGAKTHKETRRPHRKAHRLSREERNRRSEAQVRRLRTKDLKVCIAILEQEIRLELERNGHKPQTLGAILASHELPLLCAMETRLQLLRQELGARDLRDIQKGKRTMSESFLSLGARVRWAA